MWVMTYQSMETRLKEATEAMEKMDVTKPYGKSFLQRYEALAQWNEGMKPRYETKYETKVWNHKTQPPQI